MPSSHFVAVSSAANSRTTGRPERRKSHFKVAHPAIKSILKVPALAPAVPTAPASIRPILRVYSLAVRTGEAQQSCALIAENGRYRFENHYQKMGRAVNIGITSGKLNSEELVELR